MTRFVSLAVCSAALLAAVPAFAASDYFLVIDGVEGETATAVPLDSWSFGQTNTSAPRDTQTGKATGRLRESPTRASTGATSAVAVAAGGDCDDADCSNGPERAATGDLDGDGALDFARVAQRDQIGPLTFTVPASSDLARNLCGKTDHLRSGHIVKSDGTVYDLSEFSFGACTKQGPVMKITAGGGKIVHKTGHVTLMK